MASTDRNLNPGSPNYAYISGVEHSECLAFGYTGFDSEDCEQARSELPPNLEEVLSQTPPTSLRPSKVPFGRSTTARSLSLTGSTMMVVSRDEQPILTEV